MTEPEEDFAAMFEASQKAKRVDRGDSIEGTIVAIGEDVAFVDIGGKGEATIDLAELRDEHGGIEVAAGDKIQAVVLSTSGGITLSRRLMRGAATDSQIEDAYRAGLPVEGKVERAVKGGYEVRIGRSRAFCPFSQIGVPAADPAAQEGQVYQFRIIEYAEGGRNLVVSRRALLDEEKQAKAAEVKKTIVPGRDLDGPSRVGPRVRRVRGLRRRRPGTAARLRDGLGARRRAVRDGQAGRRDHRQGPAGGRSDRTDRARA